MPAYEAPSVELGSVPETPSITESPSLSEISSASSPEPQSIRATPLFRALAMLPPDPEQPPGQDELERRLPGYRRIVIPRELTLIELLKQSSGVSTDEEVLRIKKAKLRVVAERVGLRRLHVLAPRLSDLTLDGSALSSLRDLGIGLVHLKVLSVNRCGLTCLDGVWGLSALCEFYASGNRLQDLQPLAALQKLHTLNLSNNPIADTTRIWTLGVCGSLRRLTLSGTPASNTEFYRTRIATSLPMLTYLDERPLHTDIDYDEGDFGHQSDDCSDSEASDAEVAQLMLPAEAPPAEPEPGPSSQFPEATPDTVEIGQGEARDSVPSLGAIPRHRRPATTEGAGGGARPRVIVPSRPRTASDRSSAEAPSRLQILNTLMDEEWRSSGSILTSHGAVCGNLARALRRPQTARRHTEADVEKDLVAHAMEEAARALAEEIPRAPRLEDWTRFKQDTGIEIDINFNERPRGADPSEVLDRLERIEKETMERLSGDPTIHEENTAYNQGSNRALPFVNDHDFWNDLRSEPYLEPVVDVESLFRGIDIISPPTLRRNIQSQPE